MSCGRPTERRAALGGRQIVYELHRSARRRKHISFAIRDGRLRVLAPKRTRVRDIDDILEQRVEWILQRLDAPAPARLSEQIREGGALSILGSETRVAITSGRSRLVAGWLLVGDGEDPSSEAERLLREVARLRFQELIDEWTPRVGAGPKRLQIRDQKTRWGSASSSGTLSLNWRLVFAPPEVVEYVVVHELCHLIEGNHGSDYWRLVESKMADYRARVERLKAVESGLVW